MNDANPPVCSAWLHLPDGRSGCELPVGHPGQHRASDAWHTPDAASVLWWRLPRRGPVDGETPLAAA